VAGKVSKSLDKVFQENCAQVDLQASYRKKFNYQQDIETFVEEYKDEQLFHVIPGREYRSFQGFTGNWSKISEPDKFSSRLKKYSQKLDRCQTMWNKNK